VILLGIVLVAVADVSGIVTGYHLGKAHAERKIRPGTINAARKAAIKLWGTVCALSSVATLALGAVEDD
jgi:hypothetical protein